MKRIKQILTITGSVLLILLCTVSGSGCKDNASDPSDTLEEILPNSVLLTVTDTTMPGTSVLAAWSDTDGPGGSNPVIDTLKLKAGKFYSGTLSASYRGTIGGRDTVIDLTVDYLRLANEHQFFYDVSDTTKFAFTISDKDANNLPLGLSYTVKVNTTTAQEGTVRITLGHYDTVPKDGRTRSSETDIDITIPIAIAP